MKKRKFVRCGPIKLYRERGGRWVSSDNMLCLSHHEDLDWFARIGEAAMIFDTLCTRRRAASAARKLWTIISAAQGLLERPVETRRVDLGEAWSQCSSSSTPDLKVNGARPEPAPNPCAEHCERPGGPCLERATRVEKLHYEAAALTGLVRALRCPEKDCVLPRRHSGGCGVVVDGNEVAEFTDTRLYRVEVRFARVGASPAEVIESVPVIARNEDAALQIAADRVRAAYPFCAVIGVRIAPPLAVPLPSGVTAAPSEIDTGEHDA